MKRACLLLLPAMLLIVLAASGCNEESKPVFTRVSVTPSCGVVPMNVEVFAAVSGGNESGDPMGGNNNLEVTWDFGDGGSATSSVGYHRYEKPGEYTINVLAKDPDGKTTSSSVMVVVNTDSLVITADSTPPSGNIAVGTRVQFELTAAACGIDFPTVAGDSVKMIYHWAVMSATDTTDFYGSQPTFTYSTAGDYDVDVAVTYPFLAVTRHAKMHYTVGP